MSSALVRQALSRAARSLGLRGQSTAAAAAEAAVPAAAQQRLAEALGHLPTSDPTLQPYYEQLASLTVTPAAGPRDTSESERAVRAAPCWAAEVPLASGCRCCMQASVLPLLCTWRAQGCFCTRGVLYCFCGPDTACECCLRAVPQLLTARARPFARLAPPASPRPQAQLALFRMNNASLPRSVYEGHMIKATVIEVRAGAGRCRGAGAGLQQGAAAEPGCTRGCWPMAGCMGWAVPSAQDSASCRGLLTTRVSPPLPWQRPQVERRTVVLDCGLKTARVARSEITPDCIIGSTRPDATPRMPGERVAGGYWRLRSALFLALLLVAAAVLLEPLLRCLCVLHHWCWHHSCRPLAHLPPLTPCTTLHHRHHPPAARRAARGRRGAGVPGGGGHPGGRFSGQRHGGRRAAPPGGGVGGAGGAQGPGGAGQGCAAGWWGCDGAGGSRLLLVRALVRRGQHVAQRLAVSQPA